MKITDAAGEAVTRVEVYVDEGDAQFIAHTNAKTGYRVAGLDPGSHKVRVDARGTKYMSETRLVEIGPGENEVDFVLQVGRTIAGRVTWSGRSHIWVAALPYPADSGESREVQASAESGDFMIEGLAPGYYVAAADVFWYGGDSYESARVLDVTGGDVGGIDMHLGELEPLPTTTVYTATTTSHN